MDTFVPHSYGSGNTMMSEGKRKIVQPSWYDCCFEMAAIHGKINVAWNANPSFSDLQPIGKILNIALVPECKPEIAAKMNRWLKANSEHAVAEAVEIFRGRSSKLLDRTEIPLHVVNCDFCNHLSWDNLTAIEAPYRRGIAVPGGYLAVTVKGWGRKASLVHGRAFWGDVEANTLRDTSYIIQQTLAIQGWKASPILEIEYDSIGKAGKPSKFFSYIYKMTKSPDGETEDATA